MWFCFALLVSNIVIGTGSYLAGRIAERNTQLGKLLAYAPALEDMRAATRSADSLAMRFMFQWQKCRLR